MSVDALARADAAAVIDRLRPAILAARRGDQAAFRLLYQEYARSVYNLVFRCVRNQQSAEDVCQEVWVKAFRELPKLQDPQAFPAWLYRIATRACIDAARQNRRFPATSELPEERLSAADDDPERSALRRERVRLTWEAMATMPTRQHVALYLREIQNMSYKEIAQMLGTSQPAVEMLLFRGRQAFAKAYERLEAAGHDRCAHARRSMAAILDGEGTRVQQNAIRAHAGACRPCSTELAQMRRTTVAYSALLPLPIPALLSDRIFESIGATGAGAATSPASLAKVLTLAAAKAKVAGITLVVTAAATTAATVASMNTPIADGILPGPSSNQSETLAESRPSRNEASISNSTQNEGGSTGQTPAAQGAPLPVDPNQLPDITQTVDKLTGPVAGIVDQTTTDLNRSVDALLHDLAATADALPTVPPVPTLPPLPPETSPLPTLPPLPTPTVPPLPPLLP